MLGGGAVGAGGVNGTTVRGKAVPAGAAIGTSVSSKGGGTTRTPPARLAAVRGWTSGGGLLTGLGSGGGGNVAPTRAAALAGCSSGAFGFRSVGGLGAGGDVNVGTGANVVSDGGANSLAVEAGAARRLRRGVLVESKPVLPAPKPVGLP